MAAGTYFLDNKVIDDLLRVGTKYLALFTVAPGKTGGGTEVTGGAYARQVITLSAGANGATSNTNTITFPTATAAWGTLTYFGIFDALSAGNLWKFFPMTASRVINSGDVFEVPIGDIDLTVD